MGNMGGSNGNVGGGSGVSGAYAADLYARVEGTDVTPLIVKGSANVTGVTTSAAGKYLVTHTALSSTNGAVLITVEASVRFSYLDDVGQSHTTTQTPILLANSGSAGADSDYSVTVTGA
jgi:hypothetical protein